MNLFDSSAILGKLIQGIQANNMFLSVNSLGKNSDLTAKTPITSIPNIQAAYSSASTIEGIFGSSQSAANPLTQLSSMIPQMSAISNWFSSQAPTVNTSVLGSAPLSVNSNLISMGVAMGVIDPSTLDSATINSLGLPASTSTAQAASPAAAALIKKMPVVSSAKTAEILNTPADKQSMWGGVNQNVSLLSSDGSGATMLNAALPNPEDKAAFINSLSSNIDKEVRLAGRGANKEVVAEVLANELYSLYEQKVPGAKNPTGNDKQNAEYKERMINALKNISMGNVQQTSDKQLSLSNDELNALGQILPGISTKDSNPNNRWNAGFGGMMGMGGFGHSFGRVDDPKIEMLQEAVKSLTANAKENLIKKNSLA